VVIVVLTSAQQGQQANHAKQWQDHRSQDSH
jgi:hypothetical protein